MTFTLGQRVLITKGRFSGRTGTIKRPGKPDYIYVTLDPKLRERVIKTEMIARAVLVSEGVAA
jgi:hypothetical protein